MDERTCSIHRERIHSQIKVNTNRLNRYGERLDAIERDIVAQKKDTVHLQEAINALQASIDKLIEVVNDLKYRPLKKYEKVVMVVVSAIIGYLVSKWF